MPKRRGIRTIDCSEVQGEGKYVKIIGLKVGEAMALGSTEELSETEALDKAKEMFVDHVIEWNWVDDFGDPLPLPKELPEIVYDLYPEELAFLIGALSGDFKELKN